MHLIHGGQSNVLANLAGRGRRGNNFHGRGAGRGQGGRGRGDFGRGGCGQSGGHGQGRGNNNSGHGGGSSNDERPQCQVYFKKGHTTDSCWHRFEEDFVPDTKLVGIATTSYGVDTNWYTDASSIDHITSELEKLKIRDKYNGGDQIHTASGTGMDINHIGHTTIHTPNHDIHL
jgi:hypothetical protein